jgi:hypothetical protein
MRMVRLIKNLSKDPHLHGHICQERERLWLLLTESDKVHPCTGR